MRKMLIVSHVYPMAQWSDSVRAGRHQWGNNCQGLGGGFSGKLLKGRSYKVEKVGLLHAFHAAVCCILLILRCIAAETWCL